MTTLPHPAPGTELELPLRDHVLAVAIEHFGRFGFDESMLELSIAADVEVETLSELFGSIEGLRAACDEHALSVIGAAKTEALSSADPSTWSAQLDRLDSFAPILAYLVRALEVGDEPGHALLEQMIATADGYLAAAVAAGTIQPSRDPAARARFLATSGAGGFLLYRQMHATPTDVSAVLRDYARDMVMPAMELYTQGLMSDDTMYRAFRARLDTTEG